MPYLIRSRGRPHRVRGAEPDAPLYEVGAEWVAFEDLPLSVPPMGDGDLEVKEIVDAKKHKAAKAFVPPKPPAQDPRVAAAIVAPKQIGAIGIEYVSDRAAKASLAAKITPKE